MDRPTLCPDCKYLIAQQRLTGHPNLIERSHITNYTIFKCASCRSILEHSDTPNHWYMLPVHIQLIDTLIGA